MSTLVRSRPLHFHPVESPLSDQAPGDFADRPLQNLDHAALGTAMRGADARGHAIAVPEPAHFPRREEHVLAAAVRCQKAVTVLVRAHPADDQIEMVSQAILPRAIADELPVPDHGLEPAPERGLVPGALEPQMPRDGYERERAPRRLHRLDDLAARRDGMPVPAATHD